MMTEINRKAFEEQMNTRFPSMLSFELSDTDYPYYINTSVQSMWLGWTVAMFNVNEAKKASE